PADCQQGAATVVYNQHFEDALNSWVDDPLGGDNPAVICRGKDGKDGKDGNPGKAYGWHKKFGSAPISSTNTAVLSQLVSGTIPRRGRERRDGGRRCRPSLPPGSGAPAGACGNCPRLKFGLLLPAPVRQRVLPGGRPERRAAVGHRAARRAILRAREAGMVW